jgi:hypothetical protein
VLRSSVVLPDREETPMCVSCGCGAPDEKHGDDANITMQDLERAAKAANISTTQVAENIQSAL